MLEKILIKYKKEITGIIQVGANFGQELNILTKYGKNVYLFEPLNFAYRKLIDKSVQFKNVKTYNFALGDKNQISTLNIAENNGASSSLLKPTLHQKYFPEIAFNDTEKVQIKRFDEVEEIFVGNFLILDVQGFELNVLKGFGNKINQIDFIYTEYSLKPLYENSVVLDELDQFLRNYNFIRTNTKPSINKPQGDALYIRADDFESLESILFKLKSKIQISKIYMFMNLMKNPKKVIYLSKKYIKRILNI